ncbi:hypothetical protein SESBI_45745 [Sesbania bispinosa]|nr:hypothetical protein SESBI_45745 [Sesbania bispinosa]
MLSSSSVQMECPKKTQPNPPVPQPTTMGMVLPAQQGVGQAVAEVVVVELCLLPSLSSPP